MEKPISNNYESAAEFQKLNKNKINEIFVVCNLRFHQALEIIKKEIKSLEKFFLLEHTLEIGYQI